MKKGYFIVGIDDLDTKQRTIVSGVKNKLEAMMKFVEACPQMLIVSVCQINQKGKEWLLKNNMPNCKDV